MSLCACGHPERRHCDGIGRCDGTSTDEHYGKYRCVCPTYQPVTYCEARMDTFHGWSGVYPRCALPPGHEGEHSTTYGTKFDDKGEIIP